MGEKQEDQRSWQPAARPPWVTQINAEADSYDLAALLPLDAVELTGVARRRTGLDAFGGNEWEEPFALLLESLAEEASLHLLGRLAARSEILNWLENRLRITDLLGRHPEIEATPVDRPVFILGLARSGTTYLQQLLAQNPAFRPLLGREALFPTSAREESSRQRAGRFLTQINRITPEHAAMHAIGADIPIECGQILGHSFISDQIAAFYQTPRYARWLAAHPWDPAYRWHRKILQVLQWRHPARRWLLKAPAHLAHIPELLRIYPDARFLHMHRDPLKAMASVGSLLGTLCWAKSDQPFNSSAFENLMLAPGTAAQLEQMMRWRDEGLLATDAVLDIRYPDLVEEPLAVARRIHQWLAMPLAADVPEKMRRFVQEKQAAGQGTHRYAPLPAARAARDRPLFARYQARYHIANEGQEEEG